MADEAKKKDTRSDAEKEEDAAAERADAAREADAKRAEKEEREHAKAERAEERKEAKEDKEDEAKAHDVMADQAHKEVKGDRELHHEVGLRLGKRHVVASVNPGRTVEGKLVAVHDLGVSIHQDHVEHPSFMPWHNVFSVQPLE